MAEALGFGAHTHGHVCSPDRLADEIVCLQPAVIITLFAFWLMSAAATLAMRSCTRFFREMGDARHERNCVGYVINLVVTTVSLVIILAYGWPLLFNEEELDDASARMCWWFGCGMIWMLYIWELVFRIDINPSLLLHHVCTLILIAIFMGSGINAMSNDIRDDVAAVLSIAAQSRAAQNSTRLDDAAMSTSLGRIEAAHFAVLKSFQLGMVALLAACTEQPSFVALLMHRARYKAESRGRAFLVAWVWSLISKTTLFVWSAVAYISGTLDKRLATHGDEISLVRPLQICYPVLISLLYCSQLWASWILRKLSLRAMAPPVAQSKKLKDSTTLSMM